MSINPTRLFALTLVTTALHAGALTVPGTSNSWLAGMPDGSMAIGFCDPPGPPDIAPAQSPVVLNPVLPGSFLSFTVSGSVNYVPSPSDMSPDGGFINPHGAENGIGGFTGPVNSLIGVFLDLLPPNVFPPPPDFPYLPNDPILTPGLRQPFFIGDGFTGSGSGLVQRFLVPAGATRLFLGTLDGCEWSNNFGAFEVDVNSALPCPGDLDGDGDSDLQDLAGLLSHFGTPNGAAFADGDLDGDRDVDLQDLANLLANFGTTCP